MVRVYSYSPEGEFKEHSVYWEAVLRLMPIGTYLFDACEPLSRFRYGRVHGIQGWESITYDELPNEFKMQLLLLGVQ